MSSFCPAIYFVTLFFFFGLLQGCGGGGSGNSSDERSIVAVQAIDTSGDNPSNLFLHVGSAGSSTLSRVLNLGPHGGASGKRFAVSPNKKYIAYWKTVSGAVQFQVSDIHGNAPILVDNHDEVPQGEAFLWDPNGEQLIYRRPLGGVRLLDSPAWNGIDLTQPGEALVAWDWSRPEGDFFYAVHYAGGQNATILMYEESAGIVKTLHAGQFSVGALRVSPDGNYLAVSVTMGADSSVLILARDTGVITTFPDIAVAKLFWAPDSGKVFFVDTRSSHVKLIDVRTMTEKDIIDDGLPIVAHELIPSHSGAMLLFQTFALQENHYGLLDAEAGQLIYKNNFSGLTTFIWSPTDTHLSSIVGNPYDSAVVSVFDVQTKQSASVNIPEGFLMDYPVWLDAHTWAIRGSFNSLDNRMYINKNGSSQLTEVDRFIYPYPQLFEPTLESSVSSKSFFYLTAGPIDGYRPVDGGLGLLVRYDLKGESNDLLFDESGTPISAMFFDVIE